MANSPIVDAKTIDDLKTRLAALEAALGKYNAASAVLAAANSLQTSSSSTSTSTGNTVKGQYDPITQAIWYGSGTIGSLTLKTGGYAIANVNIEYSGAKFTGLPKVIANARIIDNNGYTVPAVITLGDPGLSVVTGKAYIPNMTAAPSLKTLAVDFIAVGPK